MDRRFTEFRSGSVGIEDRADGKRVIFGYAAVFFDPADSGTEYKMYSDMIERISRTAFDRAIKEDDCRALFNHDPNQILGRSKSGTCNLTIDSKGLRYEITPPDSQFARDLLESIKRGDITGSSFGFRARKTTWVEQKTDSGYIDYRYLDDVELFDVGPVTFPAYAATSTGSRSSAVDSSTELELKSWRDAKPSILVPKSRGKLLELMEKEVEIG